MITKKDGEYYQSGHCYKLLSWSYQRVNKSQLDALNRLWRKISTTSIKKKNGDIWITYYQNKFSLSCVHRHEGHELERKLNKWLKNNDNPVH